MAISYLTTAQEKFESITIPLTFNFSDIQYKGFIEYPKDSCRGIVIFIPGSGRTDFLGTGGFANFFDKKRKAFLSQGFATCAWDKAGCGNSEGYYDENQPLISSRDEALSAIQQIRVKGIPGSQNLGLWGISRGGWICPMIIEQDTSIRFWISISGTDKYDNYRYLLETNFRIEGRPHSAIQVLMNEWDFHMEALRLGTISYQTYVDSTQHLFSDPFYINLGHQRPTKEAFGELQMLYRNSGEIFDRATGIRIVKPGFEDLLAKIQCPVLAIFGEKDAQINWEKTRDLYLQTIGWHSPSNLKIISLPDCNHLMMRCKTGGMFEDLKEFNYELCEGYYKEMLQWLSSVPLK